MNRDQINQLRHAAQAAQLAIQRRERAGEHPAAWKFQDGGDEKIRVFQDNGARVLVTDIARVLTEHRVEIADWVRADAAEEVAKYTFALDKHLRKVFADGPY